MELLLGGGDDNYINVIAEQLAKVHFRHCKFGVFTDAGIMRKHLEAAGAGGPRALLVCEDFLFPDIKKYVTGPVIVLGEFENEADPDYRWVKKYQPLDRIAGEVREILNEEGGCRAGAGKLKLVTMCSPGGGSGTTLLSVALAQCLSESGMKVLYLDLQPIPGAGFYFNAPDAPRNFSGVIFYIRSDAKNVSVKIKNCSTFDTELSVSFFAPQNTFTEIDELSGADCLKLIDNIKASGGFDCVVADIGSNIGKRGVDLIENSSRVGVVARRHPEAEVKLKVFLEQLKLISIDGEQICKRLDLLENHPYGDALRGHMPDVISGVAGRFDIPYCSDIYLKTSGAPAYNPDTRLKTSLQSFAKEIRESY